MATFTLRPNIVYSNYTTVFFSDLDDQYLPGTGEKLFLYYEYNGNEYSVSNPSGTRNASGASSALSTSGACDYDFDLFNVSYPRVRFKIQSSDKTSTYWTSDWLNNPFCGSRAKSIIWTPVSGDMQPEQIWSEDSSFGIKVRPGNISGSWSNFRLAFTPTPGGDDYLASNSQFNCRDDGTYEFDNAYWSGEHRHFFVDGSTIDLVFQGGVEVWGEEMEPTITWEEIWRVRATFRANLSPTAINLEYTSANTSSSGFVSFGNLSADDPNFADIIRFAIASQTTDDNDPAQVGYFFIGGTTGKELIAAQSTPAGTYQVTLLAIDRAGGTLSETKSITLTAPESLTAITGFTATATSSTSILCSFTLPPGISSDATIDWQRSTVDPASNDFDPTTDWTTFATTDTSGNVITE